LSDIEWIKNLKVGDEVVVTTGSYGKRISKVTKITPKGFINVGHEYFNPNGSQRGGDTWHKSSLSQLTDEVMLEFKKKRLVGKCIDIKFTELTIEKLENILSIATKEE